MVKEVTYMVTDQLEVSQEIVVEKICVDINFWNQIIAYLDFNPILTTFF